ncbi:uncharacterized protein [Fopius arisanus]|uniref:Uncharacterized protein isoform X2 n=1 Tax=Fopius arisanus TaxID=64838 RepID=A0A9R1U437_9HYME|nr:PREDICTED: uncharacterized protein LOC105268487 isoform X2 [Fopius arisanus]
MSIGVVDKRSNWERRILGNFCTINVGMISVFVITILPDTITTIIYYVPSIDCCGSSTMCVIHDFMKFSTIVGPIVWGTVCQSFRDAIWGVVRCRSVDKVGE